MFNCTECSLGVNLPCEYGSSVPVDSDLLMQTSGRQDTRSSIRPLGARSGRTGISSGRGAARHGMES